MNLKEIKKLEQAIFDDEEYSETQKIINNGSCWHLEGSIGRHAMSCITAGMCMLGMDGHRDTYGNYVPSRLEVKDGTKGSPTYVKEHREDYRRE